MTVRMNALYPVLLLIILFAAPLSVAQEEVEAYHRKIDTFFKGIAEGDLENSFRAIISKSLIEGKPRDLDYLIRRTKNALSVYGDVQEYKHYKTECMDERICFSQYLSFNRNYPLLWSFIFYEGKDGWVLLHISFDDDVKTYFSAD